jgi:hypothetical protein
MGYDSENAKTSPAPTETVGEQAHEDAGDDRPDRRDGEEQTDLGG